MKAAVQIPLWMKLAAMQLALFGLTFLYHESSMATGDTWSDLAPMMIARDKQAMVAVGDKIYVFGGYSPSFLSSIEEYDTATDSWASKGSMTAPRAVHAAVTVNGKSLCHRRV